MSFEVKTAVRQGSRLLIQLSGVSGTGKTFTALQLAYGLTGGDANKIIGIDTENRRMSLNADILPGGAKFRTIDFYAPFSPARYIEAIDAACKAGAEVIVIDSVTHEWESEGGCEWIANQSRFPDWKKAKAEHKRFMTFMLQCPAHIIACTRAREKIDFTDTKNPRSLGIQPIQEKNFSFEATVSLMMHDQGNSQDVLKCPADLQRILGRGLGYITPDDGKALRAWVDGGVQIDPAIESARGNLLNSTEKGLEAFKAAWTAQTPAIRKSLGESFRDQCKASAEAYDKQRSGETLAENVQQEQNAGLDALNDAAAGVDTSDAIPAVPEAAQMAKAEEHKPAETMAAQAAEPAAQQKAAAPRRSRAAAQPAQEPHPEPQTAAVQGSVEPHPESQEVALQADEGPVPNIPPADADDLPDF